VFFRVDGWLLKLTHRFLKLSLWLYVSMYVCIGVGIGIGGKRVFVGRKLKIFYAKEALIL
jgi:hypothetical protein